MKLLRLTTMWALLMAAAQMSAQKPIVWADPVTIEPGVISDVVVNIDLDTDEKITHWNFDMTLPEGVAFVPFGFEYNGHYYGYDTERIILSPELYDVYNWVEPDYVYIYTEKQTGLIHVHWRNDIGTNPMKSTHGEMVRIVICSSLDETLTFTPVLSNVVISNDKGEVIVKDNLLQEPPSHNTLYIEDTEALVGTDFTLSVKLRNALDIEGFGFDLVLPGGMSVVKDAEGQPMVSLSEKRTSAARTNTFEVRQMNNAYNDVLRVVAASSNGSAIAAGDGEVCTVRVRIGTGLKEGKYYGQLINASVADADARSHDMEQQTFTITVLSLNLGDANGDGKVTVADMTAIAHHVLGSTPNGFSEKAADANQDGQVNVADYTAVAHLLLYGKIEAPAGTRADNVGEGPVPARIAGTDISQFDNTVYMAPLSATAGEEVVLSVRMKNAVDAEGFQFTLTLPEGVSVVRDEEGLAEACLSTERTTPARTNTFATSLQPDGSLRVMAASTNSSAIGAGDGEVCTVRIKVEADMAAGDYALLLSDVAISDTQAKSHDVDQVEVMLSVSDILGISEIANRKFVNSKCYDLQGRKIVNRKSVNRKSTKGLYISDGRKHLF